MFTLTDLLEESGQFPDEPVKIEVTQIRHGGAGVVVTLAPGERG